MSHLSEAQARVLREIIHPSPDEDPFPPMNTLHSLRRRGLIEVYRDETDPFAVMTGALTLRATEKGLEALEDHEFTLPQHQQEKA